VAVIYPNNPWGPSNPHPLAGTTPPDAFGCVMDIYGECKTPPAMLAEQTANSVEAARQSVMASHREAGIFMGEQYYGTGGAYLGPAETRWDTRVLTADGRLVEPGPTSPTMSFPSSQDVVAMANAGDYFEAAGSLCSLIPDTKARLACEALTKLPDYFGQGDPTGGKGANLDPGMSTGCQPGFHRDANGVCLSNVSPAGAQQAVMGRYGAALTPIMTQVLTRSCLPGMIVGKDGLCYNKRDLRRDERKWDPGTKPFLTGGQVKALKTAARLQKRIRQMNQKFGPKVRLITKKGRRK